MKRALAVVAVLGVVACGMMATPPGDEEMTARLRSDRAAFEALLASVRASAALSSRGPWVVNPGDTDRLGLEPATADALRRAFAELKLEWVRGDGPADGKFTFVTWAADIPGPGHQARGFVWAPSRPVGQPRSPDRASFEEYTPIDGNWYLFAELID